MRSTSCPSFAPNARSCPRRSRCSARSRRHVCCVCCGLEMHIHIVHRHAYGTFVFWGRGQSGDEFASLFLFLRKEPNVKNTHISPAPLYCFAYPALSVCLHLHSRRRDSPSWSPSARRSSPRRTCRSTRFSSCVRYCTQHHTLLFAMVDCAPCIETVSCFLCWLIRKFFRLVFSMLFPISLSVYFSPALINTFVHFQWLILVHRPRQLCMRLTSRVCIFCLCALSAPSAGQGALFRRAAHHWQAGGERRLPVAHAHRCHAVRPAPHGLVRVVRLPVMSKLESLVLYRGHWFC